MLKKFAKHIWRKSRKSEIFPSIPSSTGEGPVLSQKVTFGAHIYRQKGEIAQVVFTNPARHIQRIIIDDNGKICDFPGFLGKKEIMRNLTNGTLPKPVICFRTEFRKEADGRFLMIWEVQPDGRYWEDDDGFGGTSDQEVKLYSHIDTSGRFTQPFQLYEVGLQKLYRG